ncbi:DUF559 domain-containing protein [Hoyosella rhizosphaerae]|nr:DUF559 domain-containing protein [Hoyosella rhizosphaerae]
MNHLLANQDGVITRAQALAAALTPRQIHHRIATKQWCALHRGVYLEANRSHAPAARLRAVVFAAGRGAHAHGPSAAWWLGLLPHPPRTHYITVPTPRKATIRGCKVRRRTIATPDTTTTRGLTITALPLTILDTAVTIPDGTAFLDRALQRWTTLADLTATHQRNKGRHGARKATTMLRNARTGGESEAERLLIHHLRKHKIHGWRTQVQVRGYFLDIAFEKHKLAIEVDGWAWHRDVQRFTSDMTRQNVLINEGWRVLRFSWHHVNANPDAVVREIREALSRG